MSLTEGLALAATVLGLIATLVQLLPCKAMPWSWLAKHLGRALNGEVMERIEATNRDISAKIDLNDAKTARYRIVSFDDELRHTGIKHSEERFIQVLGDIDTYERYCAEHPEFRNHKAVHAIEYIEKVYDTCREENSFI